MKDTVSILMGIKETVFSLTYQFEKNLTNASPIGNLLI